MPGVSRVSLDLLLGIAQECVDLGIPVLALFPVIDPTLKTPDGSEAFNPNGLIPRVVESLKDRFPELGIMTDVALDPYTSHGQDGVLDESGYVLNDETSAILVKQALVQAQVGVDIVAPSDMMDGRIQKIRDALESNGHIHTQIMAYSAKYASSFYGPFRDALNSAPKSGDKKTYQMNPANKREALLEAQLDFDEGADMLMVKPALCYLDVIHMLRENFPIPITAYNVSGECAMVYAAAKSGYLNYDLAVYEILLSIRRAGADGILTYFAKDFAQMIRK
jgi:porphobilinogen synthase